MAAIALAGVFTSCEKETEGITLSGETSSVKMTVSAFSSKGGAQYAPADGIYYEGQVKSVAINDVYVVPMVGDIAYKPTLIGNIAANSTDKTSGPAAVTMPAETNGFLVYANAGALKADANMDVTHQFKAETAITGDLAGKDLVKPHGVYLFQEAKAAEANSPITYGTGSFDAAANNFDGKTKLGVAGTSEYVKVSGATYKVGSMAIAVFHGDYTDKKIETSTAADGTFTPVTGDAMETYLSANIAVEGVSIDNQPAALDYKFNPNYENVVTVYEPMDNGTDAKKIKASTVTDKLPTNAATFANTFVSVAPEKAGEKVTVNFVVKNIGTDYVKFNDEVTLDPNAYGYISAILNPATGQSDAKADLNGHIFVEKYTTMLNATITNWEKITSDIQTSVDVNVGVVVDLEWKEGVIYNENI